MTEEEITTFATSLEALAWDFRNALLFSAMALSVRILDAYVVNLLGTLGVSTEAVRLRAFYNQTGEKMDEEEVQN